MTTAEERKHNRQITTAYRRGYKIKVLSHYGDKCSCCGESQIEFLTIDHINGGGNQHRQSLTKQGRGGDPVYRWLINNNYPEGYRILCYNCNMASGLTGVCPHNRMETVPHKIIEKVLVDAGQQKFPD